MANPSGENAVRRGSATVEEEEETGCLGESVHDTMGGNIYINNENMLILLEYLAG